MGIDLRKKHRIMIEAINALFSTGDPTNIELGIIQVEAQGLDFRLFPLLAGARSLAEQIGGSWTT